MKILILSEGRNSKGMDFEPVVRAFAVQQYLNKKKADNLLIEYRPESVKDCDLRHPLFSCIDRPAKNRKKQSARLKKWKRLFYDRERRYDKVSTFLSQRCEMSDVCCNARAIKKVKPRSDCYIALREDPDEKDILTALPAEVFVIGYDAGSAHERMNSHTSLSPLFLFDSGFYSDIAVKPEKTGYVLLYMTGGYDEELAAAAVRFAEEHSLDVIELSEYSYRTMRRKEAEHPVLYDIGVEEWLGYMLQAGYVFTNSADACVLSVIFNKNFFAWKDDAGAVEKAMSGIGMNSRIVSDLTEVSEASGQPGNESMETMRREAKKKSEKFLDSSLRKAQAAHALLIIKRRYWRMRKKLGLK